MFAVNDSRRDLPPQEHAHAGRTNKKTWQDIPPGFYIVIPDYAARRGNCATGRSIAAGSSNCSRTHSTACPTTSP